MIELYRKLWVRYRRSGIELRTPTQKRSVEVDLPKGYEMRSEEYTRATGPKEAMAKIERYLREGRTWMIHGPFVLRAHRTKPGDAIPTAWIYRDEGEEDEVQN